MPAASGFQVAIFIFAFNFLVMFAIRIGGERLSVPRDSFQSLDQFITFGLAIAMLLAVPPVSRFCRDELSRPMPTSRWRDTAVVSLAIVILGEHGRDARVGLDVPGGGVPVHPAFVGRGSRTERAAGFIAAGARARTERQFTIAGGLAGSRC